MRIVFILGPTAVGKSEVAMQLASAEQDGAAILSLDSMMVYRGLDIGTGKPLPDERARVPHGGLDLVPWRERMDTARYAQAAAAFLDAQRQEGRSTVYIVGGTGLYFRALTQGLSEAPPAPPELREELAALPLEELQARLRAADPGLEMASETFDWANPRRVQRALEVITATGMPLRQWQKEHATPPTLAEDSYRAFLLLRERDDLRARISTRVSKMLEIGWVEEVRDLLAEGGPGSLDGCAAIGYEALAAWIGAGADRTELSSVRMGIVDATRQYAKRQLTWFRRESKVEPLTIAPRERPAETAQRIRAALGQPL